MGSNQGAMGGRMNQALGGRGMGLRQPPTGSGTLPQLDTPFQPGPYAQQQPVMSSTTPLPSSQGPASPAGLPQYWEGMSSQQVNDWGAQQGQPQMSTSLPAMPVTGGGAMVGGNMSADAENARRQRSQYIESMGGQITPMDPTRGGRFGGGPQGIATAPAPEVKGGSVSSPMGKPQAQPPMGVMGGVMPQAGQAKPAQKFAGGPQGIATQVPGAMGGAMFPPAQNSGQRFNDFMGKPQKG
jgi:hypothetical protein